MYTKIPAVSLAVVSDGTDRESTFLSFCGKPTTHPKPKGKAALSALAPGTTDVVYLIFVERKSIIKNITGTHSTKAELSNRDWLA